MQNNQLVFLQSIAPTAEQVLASLGMLITPPINPLNVITQLGIKHLEVSNLDLSNIIGSNFIDGISLFYQQDESYWIIYGADWHEYAKRFVIAHELGHIILHKQYLKNSSLNIKIKQFETEANKFAVDLLMPQCLIKQYVTLSASDVAKEFQVTPRAAEIRLSSIINSL